MTITINTPSGNIGRTLATALLDAGQDVTLISRSPARVADLVARGARLVEGSIEDATVLGRALEGAKALFWVTPPVDRPDHIVWAVEIARQAAEVARKRGVARAVVVSSVGAQTGPGTGPVSPMLAVEAVFRAALDNVALLRAGFFMENYLRQLDALASQGALFSPAPGDQKAPVVATRDVAAVAAGLLDPSRPWTGHRIVGVHGPEDLSADDAARIIGEALGRPVRHVEVTVDQARQSMLGMGMPAFMADVYAELYQAIRDGRMRSSEPRTAETTTPTTLAAFTREVIAPALAARG